MQIHHYHPATGAYLGPRVADPDPMELELARDAVAKPLLEQAYAVYQARLDEIVAQRAAVQPTKWLLPAYATLTAPPTTGPQEVAIMTAGGWIVAPEVTPGPVISQPGDTADATARAFRDQLLAHVRPIIDRHRDQIDLGMATTLSSEAYVSLLTYVQALRDVPAQGGFPADIDWPVLPPEIETQTPGEDPQ